MAAGKRRYAELQAWASHVLMQRMRDGEGICDFNNFSHVLMLTKIEKKYCLRLVHVFSELDFVNSLYQSLCVSSWLPKESLNKDTSNAYANEEDETSGAST